MSPLTIMTVDDDPIIRLALKKILAHDHCVVVEASDGQDALQKIRIQKPNLIILDVNMPRMTGWQLIRTLRTNPLFSLIPVIFLSVESAQQNQLQGFRLGVDAYISKPFTQQEIVNTTIRVLQKSRSFHQSFDAKATQNIKEQEIVEEYLAESDELISIDDFEARGNTEEPSIFTESSELISIDDFEVHDQSPKRKTILSGNLEKIGLSSVLSMINLERQTGLLILKSDNETEKAEIFIVKGEVFRARYENSPLENEEVIYDALTWKKGLFSFYYQDIDVEDEIDLPITSILLEGARLMDEALRNI